MKRFVVNSDDHTCVVDGQDLAQLVPLSRVTVDMRPGQAPMLYVETVGNAEIEGEGIVTHVVREAAAVDVSQAVADWLGTVDAELLNKEVCNRADWTSNPHQTVLEVLKEWALSGHTDGS